MLFYITNFGVYFRRLREMTDKKSEAEKPASGGGINRITTMLIIDAILIGGGLLTPILDHFGFLDNLFISLPFSILSSILTGIVMGVVAGRTFFSRPLGYLKKALIGTVYSSAAFWAMYGYCRLRSRVWKVELIIPLMVGLLPLLLILRRQSVIREKKKAQD